MGTHGQAGLGLPGMPEPFAGNDGSSENSHGIGDQLDNLLGGRAIRGSRKGNEHQGV